MDLESDPDATQVVELADKNRKEDDVTKEMMINSGDDAAKKQPYPNQIFLLCGGTDCEKGLDHTRTQKPTLSTWHPFYRWCCRHSPMMWPRCSQRYHFSFSSSSPPDHRVQSLLHAQHNFGLHTQPSVLSQEHGALDSHRLQQYNFILPRRNVRATLEISLIMEQGSGYLSGSHGRNCQTGSRGFQHQMGHNWDSYCGQRSTRRTTNSNGVVCLDADLV